MKETLVFPEWKKVENPMSKSTKKHQNLPKSRANS